MRKDIMSVLDLFQEKGYSCGYLTTNGTIINDERADALATLAQSYGERNYWRPAIEAYRESLKLVDNADVRAVFNAPTTTWRSWDWATAVPIAPGEAPTIAAGLPGQQLVPTGRLPQSSTFFTTGVNERLYSGVTNSTASAAATDSFMRRTDAGGSGSNRSSL